MHSRELTEQPREVPKADCSDGPHPMDRLRRGRCAPGDGCVRVMSGRQIARFFSRNPDLAGQYAGDEFWDRRAIAAGYLSQQRLLPMLDNGCDDVREIVAQSIDSQALITLLKDPHWRVRYVACHRASLDQLQAMLSNQGEDVRAISRERPADGSCLTDSHSG